MDVPLGSQPKKELTSPWLFTFLLQMGTRSRIGLQLEGQIISVYHHWDGYPEWLGVTLDKKFNTRELVEELIDGGNMSSCDSEYGWDYNYINREEVKREVSAPTYYADRGEDCPPKISESITEYLDQAERTDGEYAYLFDNGEWTCYEIQYGSRVKGRIVDIPAEFPARMAF